MALLYTIRFTKGLVDFGRVSQKKYLSFSLYEVLRKHLGLYWFPEGTITDQMRSGSNKYCSIVQCARAGDYFFKFKFVRKGIHISFLSFVFKFLSSSPYRICVNNHGIDPTTSAGGKLLVVRNEHPTNLQEPCRSFRRSDRVNNNRWGERNLWKLNERLLTENWKDWFFLEVGGFKFQSKDLCKILCMRNRQMKIKV